MTTRPVPFKALGGIFDQDDIDAAVKVMSAAAEPGGDFFPLPEEADFQAALAEHEGAAHAVAVNSCGTALDLCMIELGIGPGDEVITTPLTFICTATCASARGAKIVFADIDPVSLNLDPDKVREKITDRTRAIIPVHFGGLACDLDGFDAISREHGIPVVYDAAHSVGARQNGESIGGRGLASCYSFQSNKNITTLGEGGAITTNDPEFAENVRRKKTFGYVYTPSVNIVTTGFNYRMNKVQLAVGLTQLDKAREIISRRQERMLKMDALLAEVDVIIRPGGHGPDHGSHLYAVRLDTDKVSFATADLLDHLKETLQVGTVVHYPAVWSWEAFKEIPHDRTGCPEAEKACGQIFSLPIFTDTPDDDLEYVAWAIQESTRALG